MKLKRVEKRVTIGQAKKARKSFLARYPKTTVGIGKNAQGFTLEVRLTGKSRDSFPAVFESVPVNLRVVGKIVAREVKSA